MQAATFQDLRRVEVGGKEKPSLLGLSDAIIRVEIAGLCGSDMHPYRGTESGLDRGTTMGHEFVGRVVELGGNVSKLQVGDRVLSPFSTSCGSCGPCLRGLSSRCIQGQLFGWLQNGMGLDGAQAEYVRVPLADSTLIRCPDSISPFEGLLIGDVFATGTHIARQARFAPGEDVAVLGLGAVGLSAVLASRSLGARHIFAIDSVEDRLRLAESFGAIPVDIGRRDPADIAARVRSLGDSDGVAAVLEAVGSPLATQTAIQLLRPGGVLSIAGVHCEEHFSLTPSFAYDINLTLSIGRCPARSLMEELLEEQIEHRHGIERLITHRVPLTEAGEAYEMFDEKRDGCIKCVFEP